MVHWVFSPLTWALLLAALFGLAWRWLARPVRVAGLASGMVVLLACTPLGANLLQHRLESLVARPELCAPHTRRWPIVLMSGGFEWTPMSNDPYSALSADSWRRLRGAIAVLRRSPGSLLYISGGGPFAIKESEVLARLAQEWGVPARTLRVETESQTSWESAFALQGELPRQVRVVTTAMHMPRVMVAFRAAGFDACAAPSDWSYVPPAGWGYYVPQLSAMAKTEAAGYELAGFAAYSLRARRLRGEGGAATRAATDTSH